MCIVKVQKSMNKKLTAIEIPLKSFHFVEVVYLCQCPHGICTLAKRSQLSVPFVGKQFNERWSIESVCHVPNVLCQLALSLSFSLQIYCELRFRITVRYLRQVWHGVCVMSCAHAVKQPAEMLIAMQLNERLNDSIDAYETHFDT